MKDDRIVDAVEEFRVEDRFNASSITFFIALYLS